MVLRNSGKRAEEFLRNLSAIWVQVLKKKKNLQPCPRLKNLGVSVLIVAKLLTLANDQLDAQIFNTFITILYMYMFRAIPCSSSGEEIVFIQHLVPSLSVSDRPVHRCTASLKIHVNSLFTLTLSPR